MAYPQLNLGQFPIPAKPERYDPHLLPIPDVEKRYFTTWADRRKMTKTPIVLTVHTNAGPGESSLNGQYNWGEAGHTKPHLVIDRRGRILHVLPFDRQGNANSTVDGAEGSHGDSREWSLTIESTDLGWPNPGENNVFTDAQGEAVARAFAYWGWGCGIPAVPPPQWYLAGMCTHTEPWPYPYYTIVRGKTCPGRGKKEQFFRDVLPRVAQIMAAWTGVTEPDQPTDPTNPQEGDDVQILVKGKGTDWTYVSNFVQKTWLRTPADRDACIFLLAKHGGNPTVEIVEDHQLGGFGPIVGDIPPGVNKYGEPVGS